MFYAKDIDGMDASLRCQNLPCIGVTARSPPLMFVRKIADFRPPKQPYPCPDFRSGKASAKLQKTFCPFGAFPVLA